MAIPKVHKKYFDHRTNILYNKFEFENQRGQHQNSAIIHNGYTSEERDKQLQIQLNNMETELEQKLQYLGAKNIYYVIRITSGHKTQQSIMVT